MSSKLMFNIVTGPSIKLSEDKLSACRKNPTEELDNGWLFSDKYLNENEEFQIQILHLLSSQSESLQFGITLENPSDLKQMGLLSQNEIFKNSWMLQADKFYYQNDDNIITVEEYDFNMSLLQEGDLIGIKINEKRELCFTHNGIPFRNVAEDIPQNVWVFLNLYGKCSFITIIPNKSPITRSQKEKMIKRLKKLKESISHYSEDEIHFHSHCGKEVRLSASNHVAQRKNPTNEFRNAVVISNKPLITNKEFRLRIEGLINKWNGSIEFGVTIHNPDSFELPATMTNLRSGTLVWSGNSILTNGHGNQLPYSSTSLDDLKIGDEISVLRNTTGDVSFSINQQDLGVAGNISIEIDIWVVIDLYGRTIKVTIPSDIPKIPFSNLEDVLNSQSQEIDDKLIFHPICGRNVLITQAGYSASRINDQEFNNGVVFTNRPLKIGERWTVKLVRCVEQWAGNLEMGVTTLTPNKSDIPSTMTDSNVGYTVMLTSNGLVINGCPLSQSNPSLDLENIHSVLLNGISSLIKDSTLGVELIDHGKLQFFINNADLGVIMLETDKDIYGVIDLYGKAAEVSICLRETYNHVSILALDRFKSISSNINEISPEDTKPNIENSFSDDNSDCDRHSDHPQSEIGINEMLLDADQSFLRLLTSDDAFIDESSPNEQHLLHFHQIHGRNVILSNEGRTAYRPSPNNEFKNALVMSSRPLATDELFEICVEKMTDHWSGSLEMGVTLIRPEELNFPGTLSQLDKDCWVLSGSCLMNNGITARNDYGLDMDSIHVNSKIGIIRRETGMLHFLLDGVDMGSAYFDVPAGIYVILDLYGQCSQVSITNKTGMNLSSEHVNLNVNSPRELANYSIEFLSHSFEGLKPLSIQYISALERTMSTIRQNLCSTSEKLNDSKSSKNHADNKIINDDFNNDSVTNEKNMKINSFFCEALFGVGVASDGMGNYYTHNQNLNCLIQFKHPLKTNIYYELLFWNDKNNGYNLEPISFGIISDKISSERYFPDNLTLIKSPSWIISGGRLFINNVLRCHNFAPTLTRYKNQISVGLYFYDNSNLEVFVDHVSVGKVISDIQEECYLLINLRGWFNTLVGLGVSPKRFSCLNQSSIISQLSNYSDKDQTDFPTNNNTNELVFNVENAINRTGNLDIEDPLLVLIVNELSELLPFFFIIMHGIDTSKLMEKIVCSNNDIVLCVRKRLISRKAIVSFVNKTSFRREVQYQLIEELSNRFSHLTELKHLGKSSFEVARVLRRRILCNKVNYDDKKISFILPNSSLILEESKIRRLKSGSDFGLCILNQELQSRKSSSYEIQLIHNELLNSVESKDDSSILGLILLENSHFPNIEDVFRFLMTIPCPSRINFFHNYINQHLELQQFESKALVLIIDENCVYLNGKKICQHLPFNIKNISSEDYLSFMVVDSEFEISDIYFSIKNGPVTTSHKVLSPKWIKNSGIIKTVYPTRKAYYYVPFIWLKNQSMASITTEPRDKPIPTSVIPPTNQQDWLEKHYHDGLHKEFSRSEINSDSVVNKQDRQCISLLRSVVIKKALTLPDMFFHNTLVDCFCNNCHYPISVGNTDSTKEFRLPFGWVKYNTRLKKEERCNLSLWKPAYLTVSSGLLHRLLTSDNPNQVLASYNDAKTPQVAWLKPFTNSGELPLKSIVVSPWQPLDGCYLNEDFSIRQCTDGLINCFDPLTNSEIMAKIALEVRVKPNSFKSMECKIFTENQLEVKRIISKDGEGCENKKLIDCGAARSINQKTVWILKGDENSIVISGLLMKI